MGKLNGRKIEAMHKLYGFGADRCENCPHLVKHVWGRIYYKCSLYGDSASEATDWRLSWPACGLIDHDPEPDNWIPVIKRYERVVTIEQLPGQISMDL